MWSLFLLFLILFYTSVHLEGGSIAQWTAAQGLIPSIPQKNFSGNNYADVAEVNQQRWFEESGQCLENVDRTQLVLASGKPVLQKIFHQTCFSLNNGGKQHGQDRTWV